MSKYFIYIFFLVSLFARIKTTFGLNQQPIISNENKKELVEKNSELNKSVLIFEKDPKRALKIVEEVLIFALANGKQTGQTDSLLVFKKPYLDLQTKAYETLASFNQSKNQLDLAHLNIMEALKIYKEDLKEEPPIKLKLQLAKVLKGLKKYSESIEQYEKVVLKINSTTNPLAFVLTKNELAELYFILGSENKAEEIHNEALSIAVKHNLTRQILETNSMLGELAERRAEKDKAIDYFKIAQDIAGGLGNNELVNREYSNLLRVYQNQDKPEALTTIKSAIEFNSKNQDLKALSDNQIKLAEEFTRLNKLNQAISSFRTSINLAKKTKALPQLAKGYKELSLLYERNGNSKLALESLKAYYVVKDSLVAQQIREIKGIESFGDELKLVQSKLGLLEEEKSLDKRKIALLKQEKKLNNEALERKNTMTLYLSIGLVLMLIIILAFIKLNRSRKRANELLELKSLRTQMNPHFIFNSLNSVNNFISKSDERSANRYIADFSRLLRRVLEYSQEDLISLELEFEIIELYLKLEHSRFKDKFDYEIEIDSNIDLQMINIPPMILQPYIENAIWHGLRYRKEKGNLKVCLEERKDCYLITISDNGIGREASAKLKTKNQKSHKSVALDNINKRLTHIKKLFKTRLEVQTNDGKDNVGTVVNILLHK